VASLLLSARNLEFLLFEWLDVPRLLARERFREHTSDTVRAVLELSEQVATEQFATHNKRNDACEPTFDGTRITVIPEVKAALDVFAATGLVGAAMDADLGGLQLPNTVAQACFAWFQAANVGTAAYAFLTMANANLLAVYGTTEQIEQYVRPMLDGRILGTMCLSEPQAGSSLADVATRAEPDGEGFRLTGNKMWISGGDHELSENIAHLVLARIPGAPVGVKGLSLFLVPKYLPDGTRNDVVVAGLNHKMGFRGTTNAALNFGEGAFTPGGRAGAVGFLVGERNQGLAAMFHMMNEARIGVGLGATALGYTGYLHALDYARSRPQGRPAGSKDPSAPQVPIIAHPDVRRMLLAQKSYVEGALALILYCARLVDEQRTAPSASERDRAERLLSILTPIAKSWPSQWGLAANDLAIQVHGGYGYTREYDVEQFYRDNRLNAIHEGTHGIQALDLLGRKVVLDDGAALRELSSAIEETVEAASAAGGELADLAAALDEAFAEIVAVTARLHSAPPDIALANATVYLEAAGHVVVAWMWLSQLLAADPAGGDFYAGKWQAARYFYRWELPKVRAQVELLASLDVTTLEMAPAWF